MKLRSLFIIPALIIACTITQNSKGTIVESLTTKGLIDGGYYIYNYYTDTDAKKATLERNLENYQPTIANECEKNFTANCALLAQHCKEAEKYNTLQILQEQKKQINVIHDPILCALIDSDIEEAQKTNTAQKDVSYLESLPKEQQTKLLQLMRDIIKEQNCQKTYVQEFTKMYNALNKKKYM